MGFSKKNSVNSPLLRIMEFQWVVRILMEFQGVKGKNIGKFQRVVKVLMEFQGDGRKKKNTRKFQGVKKKKQLQKTPGRWWRFWWDSRGMEGKKKNTRKFQGVKKNNNSRKLQGGGEGFDGIPGGYNFWKKRFSTVRTIYPWIFLWLCF